MVRSSKSRPRRSARVAARAPQKALGQPDPIEREFLELWLGISRLRAYVLDERGTLPARARKRKTLAANRKPSGQVA